MTEKIQFNRPFMTGKELYYIAEAKFGNMLAGDGPFTKRCHEWLEHKSGCERGLLTHSCTAALEMAALLLDIDPGDEVRSGPRNLNKPISGKICYLFMVPAGLRYGVENDKKDETDALSGVQSQSGAGSDGRRQDAGRTSAVV